MIWEDLGRIERICGESGQDLGRIWKDLARIWRIWSGSSEVDRGDQS